MSTGWIVFLVFCGALIMAGTFINRLFRTQGTKPGPTLTGNLRSNINSSIGSLMKLKWLKILLAVAAFLAVYANWTNILNEVGTWFASTPTGTALHFSPAEVEPNRWWIDLVAVGIGLFILWMVWPKKPKGPKKWRNDSLVDILLGNIGLLLIILFGGTAVFMVVGTLGGVTLAMTDADEKIVRAVEVAFGDKPAGCGKEGGIIDVFPEGQNIVVCNDTKEFFLAPVPGHRLVYDFAPEFKEQHKHRSLKVEDYAIIEKPFTYSGSIQGVYRLALRLSVQYEYTSGWDKTPDITKVTIFVKAVPAT
ncbi:hypothetical protein KC902_00990 [Candidatus Kaiserbacteria bacterium]|nr:hypothetical protein [Candidatus Kaiserbacteria bacterium]